MNGTDSQALLLCYLYAKNDRPFYEILDAHLAVFKRQGWIRTWSEQAIRVGQYSKEELRSQLTQANLVVVLVSSDFLATDFCSSDLFEEMIARHDAGKLVIVPVIVRPVEWSLTPFQHLHALPTNGKAVSRWSDRDQACVDIVQGLTRLIEHRRGTWRVTGNLTLPPESVSGGLWTVPYRQNRFFVGREKLLDSISSAFSAWEALSTPIVALSGLGGIGKTQVALEYAYRSQKHYQTILWINASSQETVVAEMLMLAEVLGIPSMAEMDSQERLLLVKRWLAEHQSWLLILDALTDVALMTAVLPLRSVGHVLVTTHLHVSQTVAQVLEVCPLAEPAAFTLLTQRSGLYSQKYPQRPATSEETATAHRVCHLLAGLPLALDQAGAYIEETGCSIAEYEQRYHAQEVVLLQQRGAMTIDHPASVVATWSLAFQHLEIYDPCAADLLRCCAFLAPEIIPQELFLKGASQLGPHLAHVSADVTRFDAAIRTLYRFSLVRRDPQTQTISLHRLVQVVLRSSLPVDQQVLWATRVIQALCQTFPHRHEPQWKRCIFYLAHVHACEDLQAHYHLILPRMGAVVYRVGRFFHEHAQYQEASAGYQRALALCQQAPVVADTDGLPHILESLSWLALGQRRFADAHALLHQVLIIKQQVYGENHSETAMTLHMLGRLAHAQHHLEVAERFYRQALAIKEQTLGEEHAETATTVLALGWLLSDQKQYAQAHCFYQRAFRIRLKVLGTEHVSTAVVLHLLARLAQHQQQSHEAETLFLQALAVKERALCTNHPSIAITLHALAWFYQEQQRFHEAEIRYKEALHIREVMLGPTHPLTTETFHQLVCCSQERD